MRDILIIFTVLLLLLITISTLGGSLTFVHNEHGREYFTDIPSKVASVLKMTQTQSHFVDGNSSKSTGSGQSKNTNTSSSSTGHGSGSGPSHKSGSDSGDKSGSASGNKFGADASHGSASIQKSDSGHKSDTGQGSGSHKSGGSNSKDGFSDSLPIPKNTDLIEGFEGPIYATA